MRSCLILLAAVPATFAFHSRAIPLHVRSAHCSLRSSSPHMGLFDALFGSEEERARKEAEKEAAWREQQAILDRRRETGGMLSVEDEAAIYERRMRVMSEGDRQLEQLQSRADGSDKLEEWKELRESGKIKTASKGLERDADSSRFGSEGLFAERIDTKLPYVENGYVDESADVMGQFTKGFGGFFGGGKVDAPAPEAPPSTGDDGMDGAPGEK